MVAMLVWIRFQVIAARLGVRIDELFEMDAGEVQRRLEARLS